MISFKQAFDAARKAGNRYFSWNGNDYNTLTIVTGKQIGRAHV